MERHPTGDPGQPGVESMQELFHLVRQVNDNGGIRAVSGSWPRARKVLLAAELERLILILDEWSTQLHASIDSEDR